jgi:ubiquinone/menaquinone biosynthesis C-methylase UbiE
MTTRLKRWGVVALLVLAGGVALVLSGMPYLPVVHGSDADEIEQLVDWLEIEPGMRVADLGAGDGHFALALAERVGPAGHVYATEICQECLEEMRVTVAQQDLQNVTVLEGAESRTNLPAACCDAVFSRNVYHHLTVPDDINADIRQALRPGGRLLVIDFEPGGPLDRIGTPQTAERHGGHGTPTTTVIEEVTGAGFRVLRGPDPWRGRMYGVLFEAPE